MRSLILRSASRSAGDSLAIALPPAAGLVERALLAGVVAGAPPVAPAAPVVLAPSVVGVLVAGTLVVGVLVAGADVLVAPAALLGATVLVAGALAAGVVTVVVVAEEELEPPASLTSAAASTPSAMAATTAIVAIGARQLGVAASRVRAAAPQCRHQSCSGLSGVPQSGHASPPATRWGIARCRSAPAAAVCPRVAGAAPAGLPDAEAAVTSRAPAGG